MVSKEQREKLFEAVNETPGFYQTAHVADLIVERIIELGWQPPATEHTPVVEIDILNRIVSGLSPIDYVKDSNIEIYDVASIHPEVVDEWRRILGYDNYEINQMGLVRNRWTKRVLESDEVGGADYVEMHDAKGFPHYVNVRYIKEKAFGQ